MSEYGVNRGVDARKSFEAVQAEIRALSLESKDQVLRNFKEVLNNEIPWYVKLFYYLGRIVGIKLFIEFINFKDRKKLRVRDALNSRLLENSLTYHTFTFTLKDFWAFILYRYSSDQLSQERKEHIKQRMIEGMDSMIFNDYNHDDIQSLFDDCVGPIIIQEHDEIPGKKNLEQTELDQSENDDWGLNDLFCEEEEIKPANYRQLQLQVEQKNTEVVPPVPMPRKRGKFAFSEDSAQNSNNQKLEGLEEEVEYTSYKRLF